MRVRLTLLALLLAIPAYAQTPAMRTPSAVPAPAKAAPAVTGKQAAAMPELVDVNSASPAALDALPGVGAARGQAIIAGRPWTDKHDLVTRKAVPANVFAGLQNLIALVNVNTAAAEDMAKILPNVGAVRAAAIVKNRPYTTSQDLVAKGALTQGVFDGIRTMVTTK